MDFNIDKPDSLFDKITDKISKEFNDNKNDSDLYEVLKSIDQSLIFLSNRESKTDPTSFEIDLIKTIVNIQGSSQSEIILKYLTGYYIRIEYMLFQAITNNVGLTIYQTASERQLALTIPSGEPVEINPNIKFIEEKDLILSVATVPLSMGLSANLNLYLKGHYLKNE